jgi:rubrerythrin
MKESTTPGANRSGMATAPLMAREMLEVTDLTTPSTRGTAADALAPRIEYAKRSGPAATVPPPASLKELAKTAMKALKGEKATVLVDKLGERLAFERSGTRLYEGILAKFDVHGSWKGGPSRAQLERIHGDELKHFLMLQETMRELGSDPTAVTPSANVHATASKGILAVISDPRTNLRESLEAISIAELVDNDCWGNLAALARASRMEDLAERCDEALEDEQQHLEWVREWLAAALASAVGVTASVEEKARSQLTSAVRAAPRRPSVVPGPMRKRVVRPTASAKVRRKRGR